jgi:hypothetical protein
MKYYPRLDHNDLTIDGEWALQPRLFRWFWRIERYRRHIFVQVLLKEGHWPTEPIHIYNLVNSEDLTGFAMRIGRSSNTPWTIVAMYKLYRGDGKESNG